MPDNQQSARVAVIMGVSGSGKTTVGEMLAEKVGWRFQEGDALHPPENVAKMHAGHALDDKDRAPWLASIAAHIDAWLQQGERGIVTCSALKRAYRDIIIGDRAGVRLVYLEGSRELLASRMAGRKGHFMPPSLLDSQLETLEIPGPDEHPIIVSVESSVEIIVDRIAEALNRH